MVKKEDLGSRGVGRVSILVVRGFRRRSVANETGGLASYPRILQDSKETPFEA